MKTKTKKNVMTTIWILLLAIAGAAVYYFAPWKDWKTYKEKHPSLFDASLLMPGEHVPYYSDFIKTWWETKWYTLTGQTDKITYDGGELPEYVVTPGNNKDDDDDDE